MTLTSTQVDEIRRQFPALERTFGEETAIYLDGPAGTQVPRRVIQAISSYLEHCNANRGGLFPTSQESDQLLDGAHRAVGDLLNADDSRCIAFGPNMTTLTFSLSRALGRTWKRGDEVVVTHLDHDANVNPWVLAARDAEATVHRIGLLPDCTLNLEELRSKLSHRTRMVAVSCASNATGGIQPVSDICGWAHDVGARVFVDAVHYAPHARIDVREFDCDFLACSAYKFFGPHIGLLWGKRRYLEELEAYKLRPAPDALPGKWMSGTQNHECIMGVAAAIDYLADIGRVAADDQTLDRRAALDRAYLAIGRYEARLAAQLIEQFDTMDDIQVWGIRDPNRLDQRVPTFSITHAKRTPSEMAKQLGQQGIFTWHGNYYALGLTEALGLEPEGMLRIGIVHYNTPSEIDRLTKALRNIL